MNPALVVHDKQWKPHTVRYDAMNAMFLNEFLKEHRKVQEQKATIAQIKRDLGVTRCAAHCASERAGRAGLQKVSGQSLKQANRRRKCPTIPKAALPEQNSSLQSAVILHRVAVFLFHAATLTTFETSLVLVIAA
ncbi:MAG TPA: hypothetical protein VGG93_00680 [Candidatus Udaeobacter sp.]